MTDTKLNTKEILELKARAHHLHPVVMVGQQGLTDAVIKETDAALTAHELIKVRVFGDDRAERVEICNALCEAVDAQLIQHIGNFWYCGVRISKPDFRGGMSKQPFFGVAETVVRISARCRLQVFLCCRFQWFE